MGHWVPLDQKMKALLSRCELYETAKPDMKQPEGTVDVDWTGKVVFAAYQEAEYLDRLADTVHAICSLRTKKEEGWHDKS